MKKKKRNKTKNKTKKEEKDMGIIDEIMGTPKELQKTKEAPKPKSEENKADKPKEEAREVPLFASYDELKLATLDVLVQIRDELKKMNKFFEDKAK